MQQKAEAKAAETAAREKAEVARKQQEMADKGPPMRAGKLAEKGRIAAEKAAEKAEATRIKTLTSFQYEFSSGSRLRKDDSMSHPFIKMISI